MQFLELNMGMNDLRSSLVQAIQVHKMIEHTSLLVMISSGTKKIWVKLSLWLKHLENSFEDLKDSLIFTCKEQLSMMVSLDFLTLKFITRQEMFQLKSKLIWDNLISDWRNKVSNWINMVILTSQAVKTHVKLKLCIRRIPLLLESLSCWKTLIMNTQWNLNV